MIIRVIRDPAPGSILIAALAATFAAGCSGGGGSDPDPFDGIDAGGSPSGVFVAGPINGFGSVIVNGVHYDTSDAEILVNGEVATEQALRVGQIVRISATADGSTFTTNKVRYDDNVKGPIKSIDSIGSSMVVLGQTVLVTSATSFDKDISTGSLDGLSVNDIVEVSGYINSNRDIVATRVELDDDGDDFEVTGFVSNLDSGTMTFDINALTVDYSQASFEDFGGNDIANDDLVEVEGEQFGPNGEFIAREVELEGDLLDDDAEEVEIEGFITRFASPTDFDVAGVPVTTNTDTDYEGGSEADLGLDALVEVGGRLNSSGILVAEEIEFEDDGPIEIEAAVDGVDAASNQVTMLGITVEITAETRMEDDSDLELRVFTIADINVGDWLEIQGAESEPDSNIVVATSVEREDSDDDEARIQGFAKNVQDPSFQILSLPIDTDGNTEFDDIDRQTFFDIAEGRLVDAEGNLNGSRFLATEVELEDDDDD